MASRRRRPVLIARRFALTHTPSSTLPSPPPFPNAVKQRMRSVTNIQKITMAMKMVAASKMRVAQAATEQSRGLVEPFLRLLGDLPGACVLLFGRRRADRG